MTPAILYLIDILRWRGGTEIHLLELVTRLEKYGFKPIVCNLGGDEPVLRDMADAGVETWPRLMHRIYAPAGRKVIREVVAEARGRDIVAVQTFHFKSDWMGTSVARALGVPLISSRRDLGFSQTALRRLVYSFVNPRVAAFIAPSEAVKRAVCEREGVPPERVHVIYNGLDLTRFDKPCDRREAREWLGVPPDAPVAGMVSGFRPIKDHPTLLKAWRTVVDRLPDAHLALVGEGTEEQALRALTGELGLHANVTFTGPRKDIPRALAALDVFVLSSHSEGMSNAIIEAMAACRPVVATDVGGNPECVIDGVTGYIVPEGSEGALADRLHALLSDSTLASRMGSAGRARAADLFDIEAMVQRTAGLYERIARAPGREAARAG